MIRDGGVPSSPNSTLPATEQWVGELLHDQAALDTLKSCVPRIWLVLTSRLVLVDAPPPCTDGNTKAITAEDTVRENPVIRDGGSTCRGAPTPHLLFIGG